MYTGVWWVATTGLEVSQTWGSTERKQLGEGDGVEGIKGRIRCEDVEGEGKDVRWPGVYGEYPCRGEAWGRRG